MTIRSVWVALIFALCFATPLTAAEGVLVVHTRDSEGTSVPGVNLTVADKQEPRRPSFGRSPQPGVFVRGKTGAEGIYELKNLTERTYLIRAWAPGTGKTQSVEVTVKAGGATSCNIDFAGVLYRSLVIDDAGAVVPGAEFSFGHPGVSGLRMSAVTDDLGQLIALLPAGPLKLFHSSCRYEALTAAASSLTELPKKIVLERGGQVHLIVSTSDGSELPFQFSVETRSPKWLPPMCMAVSAPGGRTTIGGIRPGRYELRLTGQLNGRAAASNWIPVELKIGAPAEAHFVLTPLQQEEPEEPENKTMRVLTLDGAPVANAEIHVAGIDQTFPVNKEGEWSTAAVADKRQASRLTISAPGFCSRVVYPTYAWKKGIPSSVVLRSACRVNLAISGFTLGEGERLDVTATADDRATDQSNFRCVVEADGTLTGVPIGRVALDVKLVSRGSMHWLARTPVTDVSAGGANEIEVTAGPRVMLRGTVLINGERVGKGSLRISGRRDKQKVRIAKDGSFSHQIFGQGYRRFVFTAHGRDSRPVGMPLFLPPPETPEIEINYESHSVNGRILMPDGAPAKNVLGRVRSHGDRTAVGSFVTDPTGHFDIELVTGRYGVQFEQVPEEHLAPVVIITAPSSTPIAIELLACREAIVRVRTEAGTLARASQAHYSDGSSFPVQLPFLRDMVALVPTKPGWLFLQSPGETGRSACCFVEVPPLDSGSPDAPVKITGTNRAGVRLSVHIAPELRLGEGSWPFRIVSDDVSFRPEFGSWETTGRGNRYVVVPEGSYRVETRSHDGTLSSRSVTVGPTRYIQVNLTSP